MSAILKANRKYILLLCYILLLFSCRFEPPTGDLLHYGSCKNDEADKLKMNTDRDSSKQECIFYEYDGVDNLYFTHTNADFNCCPQAITAEIEIRGDNIAITENGDGACRCNCLYDLEFVVRNIDQGVYWLEIDSEDGGLGMEIDLTANYSGSYCIEREGYPYD